VTTYSAAIALANGELRTTRPHPAPQAVDDVVDQILYSIRDGSSITSVALQIDTDDAPAPAQEPLPGIDPATDGGTHAADPLSS
jgi:hypothetical protein